MKCLVLIIFIALLAKGQLNTTKCNSVWDVKGPSGNVYKKICRIQESQTFDKARSICTSIGMKILKIRNENDYNATVSGLVAALGVRANNSTLFHIDGFKDGENIWRFLGEGTPIWPDVVPANEDDVIQSNTIMIHGNGKGGWLPYAHDSCDGGSYLCEYDVTEPPIEAIGYPLSKTITPATSRCSNSFSIKNLAGEAYKEICKMNVTAESFQRAYQQCVEYGMRLLTIKTPTEFTAAQEFLIKVHGAGATFNNRYYIDGFKDDNDEWRYINDNSKVLQIIIPNNGTGVLSAKYIMLHGNKNINWNPWAHDPCEKAAYLCEYDTPPPSQDVTVSPPVIIGTTEAPVLSACNHRRDIINAQGEVYKSACMVPRSNTFDQAYTVCESIGMKLFSVRNRVELEGLNALSLQSVGTGEGIAWDFIIDGYKDGNDVWRYYADHSPLWPGIVPANGSDGVAPHTMRVAGNTIGGFYPYAYDRCYLAGSWYFCEYGVKVFYPLDNTTYPITPTVTPAVNECNSSWTIKNSAGKPYKQICQITQVETFHRAFQACQAYNMRMLAIRDQNEFDHTVNFLSYLHGKTAGFTIRYFVDGFKNAINEWRFMSDNQLVWSGVIPKNGTAKIAAKSFMLHGNGNGGFYPYSHDPCEDAKYLCEYDPLEPSSTTTTTPATTIPDLPTTTTTTTPAPTTITTSTPAPTTTTRATTTRLMSTTTIKTTTKPPVSSESCEAPPKKSPRKSKRCPCKKKGKSSVLDVLLSYFFNTCPEKCSYKKHESSSESESREDFTALLLKNVN